MPGPGRRCDRSTGSDRGVGLPLAADTLRVAGGGVAGEVVERAAVGCGLPGGAAVDWTSTDDAQWVLGGQFLRTTSKADFPGVGVEDAVEIIGYEASAKRYHLWRFSSTTTT